MAVLVSQSSIEPVSVAEVKVWAKIEHDDEDGVIAAMIKQCRLELERYLKIAFVTQVWRTYHDQISKPIYSPMIPLTAVAIATEDDEGQYTVNQAAFKFDQSTGRIRPTDYYGIGHETPDSVQVTYTSTVTDLPKNLRGALLDLVAYRFYNRGNIEASAIPATVMAQVQHLRVVSL